ncbi:MAG: cupin domain-containing protein [Casimicrobium sp.]
MKLTHFTPSTAQTPSIDYPKPERLLVGNPKRETWSAVDAPANATNFSTGIWRCEPGKWRIEFGASKHEVFTVHSGRCRIHDDAGSYEEVVAGESLHIPPNFKGAFEVLETITKTYVILE